MTTTAYSAAPIPSGWKARETAAKAKREANVVSPEVRAARAAILNRMDEAREATREAEAKAKTRPLESFRVALASIPDNALAELASYVGMLNPREMAAVAGEMMNARFRERIMARPAMPETAPALPAAEPPENAPGESVRRRGRPPGTPAA